MPEMRECLHPSIDRAELAVVQRFELVYFQAPNRDLAERGEDVAFDSSAVAVQRRLGQRVRSPWEPLAGEVRAKGQRPGLVVSAFDLGSEMLGEWASEVWYKHVPAEVG